MKLNLIYLNTHVEQRLLLLHHCTCAQLNLFFLSRKTKLEFYFIQLIYYNNYMV